MDQKRYWVGFNLARGIGVVRLRALIQYFGDPASAWQGSPEELRAAGLGPKVISRLLEVCKGVDLDRLWDKITAQGNRILTQDDENYHLV